VARGVYDIDPIIIPISGSGCGSDSYATLFLLWHPVHSSGTFINSAYFANSAWEIKSSLGYCGFACVNVRDKSNISDFVYGKIIIHGLYLQPLGL
jgi:hypothetical protein